MLYILVKGWGNINTLVIQLFLQLFSLKEEFTLKGNVDWYVLNNVRNSLFLLYSFEAKINNRVGFEKHNPKFQYSMSYKDKYNLYKFFLSKIV